MKLTIPFFLLFIGLNAYPQETISDSEFDNFLQDAVLENAPVSIYVWDMDSSNVVLSKNPNMAITPASVLKLLTTATAIEMLGPDYRFQTSVSTYGALENKTLNGDLMVIGGGDPTLGSDYFSEYRDQNFLQTWAKNVKEAGIDTISGNIIANRAVYKDHDVPQTWIWEDLGNYFGAAAQGISVYNNTFKIVFNTGVVPGEKTELLGTEPFIPDLSFENYVVAAEDKRDRAFVFGSPFDSHRIIKGTLPVGRESFSIKASIPNPANLLAFELSKALTLEGVVVLGDYGYSDKEIDSDSLKTIIDWPSPVLSEIIQQLNYESVNLFAEHLLKQMALEQKGSASTKQGLKIIKKFWKDNGIDTSFLFLADGSGLSRANAISAKTLVEVLNYMKNSPNFEAYRNSIPLTGLQGTQQYYFQQSPVKGKVHAKSGSMTRVRSFAGYMTTEKGNHLAYAIMVNNFNCGSFAMAHKMEKVIEEIYYNH